jgi:hypothetical protein
MKLPPNFAREFVHPSRSMGGAIQKGWKVRIGNKLVFISCSNVRHPGIIRRRIEKVLGIDPRPMKTQEELITGKARISAQMKRSFRNRIAKEPTGTKWRKSRTLQAIKNEDRALDVAQKWQRMGEYRR